MNSKVSRIVFTLILIVSILCVSSLVVFAKDPTTVLNTLNESVKKDTTNTNGIAQIGASLINIITTAGVVIAVIVLMILGVKYMMGSAEEKAEYKKTMIPYLVGAILIFGASAIAKVVITFANGISNVA